MKCFQLLEDKAIRLKKNSNLLIIKISIYRSFTFNVVDTVSFFLLIYAFDVILRKAFFIPKSINIFIVYIIDIFITDFLLHFCFTFL